mgnify:FL=1
MSFLIYPTIKQAPILGMLGMGGGIARARGATVVSYTYTGYALNRSAGNGGGGAADGGTVQSGNAGSQSNPPSTATATFTTGIPYTTLRVVYGNMANGALGNPSSGATLYINGSGVSAAGTYSSNGYNASYIKYYDASNGTLNSIGISAGVSGSHESHIAAIIIDGNKLLATGPEY